MDGVLREIEAARFDDARRRAAFADAERGPVKGEEPPPPGLEQSPLGPPGGPTLWRWRGSVRWRHKPVALVEPLQFMGAGSTPVKSQLLGMKRIRSASGS